MIHNFPHKNTGNMKKQNNRSLSKKGLWKTNSSIFVPPDPRPQHQPQLGNRAPTAVLPVPPYHLLGILFPFLLIYSLLYPSPQLQQAAPDNPQTTPAREAGRLSVETLPFPPFPQIEPQSYTLHSRPFGVTSFSCLLLFQGDNISRSW